MIKYLYVPLSSLHEHRELWTAGIEYVTCDLFVYHCTALRCLANVIADLINLLNMEIDFEMADQKRPRK